MKVCSILRMENVDRCLQTLITPLIQALHFHITKSCQCSGVLIPRFPLVPGAANLLVYCPSSRDERALDAGTSVVSIVHLLLTTDIFLIYYEALLR